MKRKVLCCKRTYKVWNVNVNNILMSKLVKKNNYKYLIGYLDIGIRLLVLIMPKMSGYVKTFKVKDDNKDKNKKLMSFFVDGEKLLEKYKAIWNQIEVLKNIVLNGLLVLDGRYVKTKITTYNKKVYTKFRGLNLQEDSIKCESFTVIFIDSLLVFESKCYLQVYLDNCVYKKL